MATQEGWQGREIGPFSKWTSTDRDAPLEHVKAEEFLSALRISLTLDQAEASSQGIDVAAIEPIISDYRTSFLDGAEGRALVPPSPLARIERSRWSISVGLAKEALYESREARESWLREGDIQRAAYANLYAAGALILLGKTDDAITLYRDSSVRLVPDGLQSAPEWLLPDSTLTEIILPSIREIYPENDPLLQPDIGLPLGSTIETTVPINGIVLGVNDESRTSDVLSIEAFSELLRQYDSGLGSGTSQPYFRWDEQNRPGAYVSSTSTPERTAIPATLFRE